MPKYLEFPKEAKAHLSIIKMPDNQYITMFQALDGKPHESIVLLMAMVEGMAETVINGEKRPKEDLPVVALDILDKLSAEIQRKHPDASQKLFEDVLAQYGATVLKVHPKDPPSGG